MSGDVYEDMVYGLNYGLNSGYNNCCKGKTRFKSVEYGLRAIKSREHKNKEVYLCPFCGYYHYGTKANKSLMRDLPLLIDYSHIQLLKVKIRVKNKLEDKLNYIKYTKGMI
jgi:hypothetical protein